MKKSILAALIALAAGAITPARAVDYYDPSDRTVKASPNATTLTTQTLLSGGWYVVPAGTTTIADRITVSNSVNLVLSDGATLNANSGISVTGGKVRIYIEKGESPVRYYRIMGRETLNSAPVDVTDQADNLSSTPYRFFHVEVSLER